MSFFKSSYNEGLFKPSYSSEGLFKSSYNENLFKSSYSSESLLKSSYPIWIIVNAAGIFITAVNTVRLLVTEVDLGNTLA